jgi:hypothetical protein
MTRTPVTAESIAIGQYPELARARFGTRGLVFLLLDRGDVAVVTVDLDEHDHVARVRGTLYVRRFDFHKLEAAIAQVAARRGGGA